MKTKHIILSAAIAAVSTITTQAATITAPNPRPAEGVPYDWFVALGSNDSAELVGHFGAWSWEDNALFNAANNEPPVGWTHTSKWVGFTLATATRLTVQMERKADVSWPSGSDPLRVADVSSMFPSFTLWRGQDTAGPQDHTYDNHGNPVWADGLSFITFVDNSTETSISRTYILPAGTYTAVLGSNAPATNPLRQGFKATLSTTPIATPVAHTGQELPGLPGVKYKVLGSPTINDDDGIAFRATLVGTGVTASTDDSILAEVGTNPLAIIAREGQADAATGSTFAAFTDPVSDNNDNVLFQARVKPLAGEIPVTAANDLGIYRYVAATSSIQQIAREGTAANGTGGALFASFPAMVADSAGGAFYAMLKKDTTIVTSANDEGVWVFDSTGSPTLAVRQGSAFEVAPGDSRVVTAIHFLTTQAGVRGAGRSTNAVGGRVLRLTFADKTTGIFTIAP